MTQAFNLSQLANNVNTSGQLNAAAGLYNQVPVANGGTGVATVATGNILVGAGTSAMTALAGTNTNDVVTWNGTTWTSAISAGGPAPVVRIYTSPSPWTKPASLKGVKITMVGGGGSGGASSQNIAGTAAGGGGGGGGFGWFPAPTIPGPLTVTVGAGGAAVSNPAPQTSSTGNSGGTSSFGALMTITGGSGGVATSGNAISAGGAGGGSYSASGQIFSIVGYSASNTLAGPATFSSGASSAFTWGTGGAGLYTPGGSGTASTGVGYGSGGGGSVASPNRPAGTVISGAGAAGVIIVEEFY